LPTRQRVFCASLADVFEKNPQLANWRGELLRLIEQTPNLDWLILTKRPENIFSLGTDAAGVIFDLWLADHPNVWLGTTAESQETWDERVPILLRTMAKVNFVSVEPMLSAVSIMNPTRAKVDWVICGGESGQGCRPMDVEWALALRYQCSTAGVPFFMKQLGGHPSKRDKMEDFPLALRVREFPEVAR
jgi:protein gp37